MLTLPRAESPDRLVFHDRRLGVLILAHDPERGVWQATAYRPMFRGGSFEPLVLTTATL